MECLYRHRDQQALVPEAGLHPSRLTEACHCQETPTLQALPNFPACTDGSAWTAYYKAASCTIDDPLPYASGRLSHSLIRRSFVTLQRSNLCLKPSSSTNNRGSLIQIDLKPEHESAVIWAGRASAWMYRTSMRSASLYRIFPRARPSILGHGPLSNACNHRQA